jgi:hypothetical protein
MMNSIDFTEPSFDTLETGKWFNLTGLINAEPIVQVYKKNNQVMQRFSLITIGFAQVIVEIWHREKETEIEFGSDWRNLQLVVIKGAKYHGISHMDSNEYLPKMKRCFVFRISSKNKKHRFIWLSSPFRSFWIYPYSKAPKRADAEKLELEIQEVSYSKYFDDILFSKRVFYF